MAKNEKEPEEISTTDKLKAFKAMKEAGLRAEMGTSGVPTVICISANDIEKTIKSVKKIFKELRYVGSFGVRGPRKTDMLDSGSEAEKTEEIQEMTA